MTIAQRIGQMHDSLESNSKARDLMHAVRYMALAQGNKSTALQMAEARVRCHAFRLC